MNQPARSVDILLATYNGASFLPDLLRSLEWQTFRGWRLIARDDGSSDATRSLLREFQGRHPAAVRLIEDDDSRLGPLRNFSRLLENSTADFVFFCDQDDVWHHDKVQALLTVALSRERPGVPLLVHSDLNVVDGDLRERAPSFWRYQFIRPERCRWSQLLVQNVVTGCACLINAELRRASLPIPRDAIMHDWWVALVASVSGEIHWIETPTVCYRQHGSNDTGAKQWGLRYWLQRSGALFRTESLKRKMRAYQMQAEVLARHPSAKIPESTCLALEQFAGLNRLNYFSRVQFVWRQGIMKTGLLKNMIWLKSL